MNETNEQYTLDNSEYTTNSIMQLRLDCKALIDRLKFLLEGSKIIPEINEDGDAVYKKVQIAEPKANQEGVNSLVSFLESKVNPQVVQGFFASNAKGYSEEYRLYIYDVHVSLTRTIGINYGNWGIKDTDIGLIIDSFMHAIKPFMSRLVGDGERKSYSQTMKVSENNTIKEQGGFNLFSKKS